MNLSANDMSNEWLETDGLGGFASGTVSGIRTRRYHALLLHASSPPTGRKVLVSGLEAWVETARGLIALSAQRYRPDIVHPDGCSRIGHFSTEPWPTWRYRVDENTEITQELFVKHGSGETLIRWSAPKTSKRIRLKVRPLLSGRDYHSLHHENSSFRFEADVDGDTITWRPYPGVPAIQAVANAKYEHAPDWYRNFLYREEQLRGLDSVEDLASPGVFAWDLDKGDAILILRAIESDQPVRFDGTRPIEYARKIEAVERRRRATLEKPLGRAADAYLVRRGSGKTIIAGYPWFTDWGRDTFIALRGLCIARGVLVTARDILLEWAGAVSDGMLPNRFPDAGEQPEYNSVDASLWYVVAVHDLFETAKRDSVMLTAASRQTLEKACEAIVLGYSRGTRFGIRMDSDGLLAAGVPGAQLTWMDAKVGDWVVTPRIGKPIEVQALWCNALRIVGEWSPGWMANHDRALAAVRARFWREDVRCLYDVVDADHVPGRMDSSFRPNQIFAVGGMPFPLFEGDQAKAIVDHVEQHLLTPLGLRSLARSDTAYRARYEGGVTERDSAYHQGTIWPWLMGPFVESWLRVRNFTSEAREDARQRFMRPLLDHLTTAGLGHLPEIADAEPPHTSRGCPFQAWSLGELLRIQALIDDPGVGGTRNRRARNSSSPVSNRPGVHARRK